MIFLTKLHIVSQKALNMAAGYKKPLIMLVLLLFTIILVLLNLVKTVISPIWRLIMGARVPIVVRTPEERFKGLERLGYTFKPNYLR
jgi:hypothetical protein